MERDGRSVSCDALNTCSLYDSPSVQFFIVKSMYDDGIFHTLLLHCHKAQDKGKEWIGQKKKEPRTTTYKTMMST